MNTTNVFVELLVIGLGPMATALLILGLAFDPAALGAASLVRGGAEFIRSERERDRARERT